MDDYATAIIAAFGGMLVLLAIIMFLQALVCARVKLRRWRENKDVAQRVEDLLTRPPLGIVPMLSDEEKASMRVYWLAHQDKLVNEYQED